MFSLFLSFLFIFFRILVGVARKITRLQREFLWGGNDGVKKIASVKWDVVCRSREQGELGIKNIKLFNIALLGKWRWRLLREERLLWSLVLKSKYGELVKMLVRKVSNLDSIWWRDLVETCGERREESWFDNNITWKLGDGKRLNFWHNIWVGNQTLASKFNRLFLNSMQKEGFIGDVG